MDKQPDWKPWLTSKKKLTLKSQVKVKKSRHWHNYGNITKDFQQINELSICRG